MPKITDFISPASSPYYREPEALERGKRMNSANTFLNSLTGNYYDAGLRDYENQESLRFNNQGVFNTFFNFAANMGLRRLKAAAGLAGGVHGLALGVENLLDNNPQSTFSEGYDASLYRDVNEALNYSIDDIAPTFREQGFDERTFMQQLANPGQLATAHRETLGILMESAVGGAALAPLKIGTRLTQAAARPLSYTKLFQNLRPNNYAKIASVLDERIASTLLRTHESGAEAHDAWQTTIDKLKQQREQGLNAYTDQEIAEMADQNFGNVFALDMLLGTITDTAFVRLFRPIFSKGAVNSRLNKFGLEMADAPTLDKFIETEPPKMSKFKKMMAGRMGDYVKLGKEIILQGVPEAAEENMQFSNQEVNNGNNLRQSFLENAYAAIENVMTEGLTFWNDDERTKAIGAGFLMGGGAAVATSLPIVGRPFNGGVLGQAKAERLQKQQAKEELNKAFSDFVSTSLVKKEADVSGKLVREELPDGTVKYSNQVANNTSEITEDEYNNLSQTLNASEDGNYTIPGGIELDEQGNVVKDLSKAAEFTATMQYQSELDNLIDLEAVKQNPDPTKLRLYELEKLTNLAGIAFRTGTTDLLMKKLDSFKDMGESSLQRFGVDNPADVNEKIDRMKEHVAKLEANYLQTTNGMIAATFGAEADRRFEMLKSYAGNIGNRLVNLYSLTEDLDKEISETVMQIPDKGRASWIMTAFETDNTANKPEGKTSPYEGKLAELVSKKKDLSEAIKELGGLYDRLTNPKTGFKEYNKFVSANKLSEYKTLRMQSKVFSPNENSTPKTLTDFVAKRANMLKQKFKLETARAMFYADNLEILENFIAENADNLTEIVDSFESVYKYITKEGIPISVDRAAKLKEIITTIEGLIAIKEAQLLGQDPETYVSEPTNLTFFIEDNLDGDPDAVAAAEKIIKAKEMLAGIIVDKQTAFNVIDAQTSSFDISRSEEDYQQEVLNELMQGPKRILEVAEYEDGAISEYYDDVAAVEKQLKFAKLLQEKSLSKLDDPMYKEASAKLEDIIRDLEKVLELAKENVKNLEVKNKKEDLHYAEAVLAFAPLVGGSTVVTQTTSTEAKEKDLQDQIDKVAEEKQKALEAFDDKALAEEPAQITDDVSDDEYNDFVDTGNVSEQRLDSIANRLKNSYGLSDREFAIFQAKTSNIESRLAQMAQSSPVATTVTAPAQPVSSTNISAIERRRQEELNNVGIKQKTAAFEKLREAKTPEEKLNAINLIDENVAKGAVLTEKEQREIQKIKDELSSQGYETLEFLGKRFNQGMKVIVTTSTFDESLAEGEEIITNVLTPQINKDDKMVQAAQIEVTVGTKKGGLTREQWLEEQKKKETITDKINARYDAELATLKGESEVFVESAEQKKKREKQRQDIVDSYDAKIKSLKEAKAQLAAEPKAAATTTVSDIDLQKLIEEDPELGAMAVMDLLAQEDKADGILDGLTETFKQLLNALDLNAISTQKRVGTKLFSAEVKEEAIKNPIRGIFEVLSVIEANEPVKEDIDPLINYMKDYDIIKFKENLKNYRGKVPVESIAKLIELHAKFIGAQQIKDAQNSNFSHVQFLSSLRDYIKANPTQPVPSSSQVRVVRELVTFAMAPVVEDAEMYQNGAALKAPAGAGKSLVVSKLFKHVMGYTDAQIRSAAAFPKAADNIASSLGHPKEGKTIQELTEQLNAGTLPEDVKFLIVDEAGPISRELLNDFTRALNAYNKSGKKNKVKFLFLYDPNQPVAGNINKPALDADYVTDLNRNDQYLKATEAEKASFRRGELKFSGSEVVRQVPLIQNIKQITSLSTTYRSGVSEVVDLQNAFKSDAEVITVSTASSSDPSLSMENIFGTFAEAGSSIVKKYTEAEAKNPQRTRVILVGNAAKQAEYKKLLPNADVVISSEAAGITVDEVYIDISKNDVESFSNPTIFNQWVYGAISRATSYAHLANWPNATHFVDTKIQPYEKKAVDNKDIIDSYEEKINKLSAVTNVAVTKTPSEKTVDDTKKAEENETAKDREGKVTPDETKEGPGESNQAKDNNGDSKNKEPIKKEPGTFYTMKHPTFISFDEDINNGIPPVQVGESLMVFVDNSEKPDGTPGERIVLVRKIDSDGGAFYQTVGIVADDEIKDFEEHTGISKAALPRHTLIKSTINHSLFKSAAPIETFEVLFVQEGSGKLEYVYDAKPQEDFSDLVGADGKVTDMPLLKKYIDSVWGKDNIENYDEVLKNFDKYTKIMSFKNEKEAGEVFPDLVGTDKLPRPGVPYLVISGLTLKTGFKARPQFIQLTTKVINNKDAAFAPLISFIKKLAEFETLLENTAALPAIYQNMRSGIPIVIKGEQYFPFHSLITALSNAHHDPSIKKITILSEKDKKNFETSFPTLDREKISPELLALAAEIDFLVHGDLNRTVDENGKMRANTRRFEGDAQKLLDAISSQNLAVSVDKGENAGALIFLRDYKSTFRPNAKTGKTTRSTNTSGSRLMGNIKFIRDGGAGAYNPLISERFIYRIQAYLESLLQRGLGESVRYKQVESFLGKLQRKNETPHLRPLTSLELQDVFITSADENGNLTNLSEGFGLRTPAPNSINYKVVKDISIKDQDVSLYNTHLSGIKKTRLIVSKEKNAVSNPEQQQATRAARSERALLTTSIVAGATEADIQDTFSAQAIANFIADLGKNSLKEAIKAIRENIKETRAYITKKHNILNAALKRVGLKTTKESIQEDLFDSLSVRETYREGIASIDFLRAATLIRIFDIKSQKVEDLFPLINFVRTNYFSPDVRDSLGFSVKLIGLMDQYGVDIRTIVPRLNEVIKAYKEIADEYGINYTQELIDENIPDGIILDIIEDGLIFDVLEGRFLSDGTWKRGITGLGIELRGLHNKNQIDLGVPFQNVVTAAMQNNPITQEDLDKEQQAEDNGTEPDLPEPVVKAVNDVVKLAQDLLDFINANPNADSVDIGSKAFELNSQLADAFINEQETHYSYWKPFLEDVIARGELERNKKFLTEDSGRPLNRKEVEDMVNRYTPKGFLETLKYIFSGKGPKELINIVKFNELVNSQGQAVWGLYKNGVMSFAQLASGGVSSKVVRHELFHKIFWEYLKPVEQMQVLSAAQDKYGDLDPESLEEALAEEFEDYVVSKRKSFLSIFWNKLKRLLGFTYNNLDSIEEFFDLIENKAFYRRVRKFDDVERSSLNIRSVFDDYQEFKIVKDLILAKVVEEQTNRREAEKEGSDVPVKSFAEITVEAMKYLQELLDTDPNKFPPGYDAAGVETVKRAIRKAVNSATFLKSFNDTYFSNTNNRAEFIEMLREARDKRLADLEEAKKRLEANFAEDAEFAAEDEELDRDDIAGLSDETLDSMLVDPLTKLTGSIKQRLISIPYYLRGTKNYADLATAFTILVPRVSSIPTHSLKEALVAMQQTFGKPTIQRVGDKPNIKAAVINHMSNMVADLLVKMEDRTMAKNVVFRKDATHNVMYALIDRNGGDVSNVTYADREQNPDRYVEVALEEGKPVDQFIDEIASITNKSKADIAKVYYFYEDIDFIKSLIAAVGSMRKSKPYVYQKSMSYGRFRLSGYVIKSGGGRSTHTANIMFAFDKYIKNQLSSGAAKLFSDELLKALATAKADNRIESKRAAIMILMKDLGITRKLTEASPESVNAVFSRLYNSSAAIQDAFKTPQKENETDEEFRERMSAQNLLGEEAGLLNEISDMINSHYLLAESGSYTRGDGKKAYGWIDASWQTDVLNALERIQQGLPFKKFSIFTAVDKAISTSDIFLKDNIFFNKKNKVHEAVDHDSIKWKDRSRWAKTLRKETLQEFRERNIVGNYFVALASKKNKYFQTLPIPSNRTTVQSVLVNALTKPKEIDEALLSIIKAQKNRPNPDAKNPDGSFMHPELHNSETYRKRWKQFTLPGLSGNVDSMTESQALAAVKAHIQKEVFSEDGIYTAFKDSLETPAKVQVPDWAVRNVASTLGVKQPQEWDYSWTDEQKKAFLNQKNEVVKVALVNFYANYIINQYSLAQILYGDETFYKSKEDQTKRIQIATATGDTLLTDPSYGIPASSKVLVVQDMFETIDDELEGLLSSSLDQEFAASDAEGFMLPEFYEKIAAAYGFDAKADVVLKPVYFSIENGVPRAIKYSVKVLTPELIAKFPNLQTYADLMRSKGIDQMVFASAMKIGGPDKKNLARLTEEGDIDVSSVSDLNMLSINNENLRFQLNPAKDVDASVANKSQGTAMMNTNGKNTAEAYEMHKANAFVIENGLRSISRDMRLTRKGGTTQSTETKLRKLLSKMLDGLPGGRDVHEMLTKGKGKTKVPLDMPLIGDRVMSTLSSIFTSATVGFRFPGSKLVLQADLGPVEIYNPETGKMEKRRLKWRDKDGFCEVILPESYRPFMDQIKDGVIGFRIPTSNYHSLLPIKVVGFYPVPKTGSSKGNVIIAPSMIVFYHGSDYDVDTLFVARKDYPEETVDLNPMLKAISPDHVDSDNFIIEKGEPYGYKNNTTTLINGYKLYEVLDNYLVTLNKQLESLTAQFKNASEFSKQVIENEITEKEEIFAKLSKIAETAAKNFIVHNFSQNMRDMKNRTDLLTPISFDAIVRMRNDVAKELEEKLDDETFIERLIKSGLIKQKC